MLFIRIISFICSSFLSLFFSATVAYGHFSEITLGDEVVRIEHVDAGPGKFFVHVHQNETTAVQAARYVISEDGGQLVTLHHSGGRNIVFHLDGKRFEFDPNRMFTDKGIEDTLRTHGDYTPKAHQAVKTLARAFLRYIPKSERIIAVHNNQDYSMKLYLKGEALENDAAQVHFKPGTSLRNFYLVTQKRDFLKLKQHDLNGLLQAKNAIDDGSLSVYLAKKPYINVEAAYDAFDAQVDMLRVI